MKRAVLFLVAILALSVGLAQAQIKPDALVVQKGQFFDGNGAAISSSQIQQIIGSDIYNQTYVGAMKQFNAGKKLITWGLIGTGIGLAATVAAAALIPTSDVNTWYAGVYGAAAIASLGGTALAVGIPLKVIGSKRLNWIAEDYNAKQSTVSFNITGCRGGYGLGLALNF